MKQILFALLLGLMTIGLNSCGNSRATHSNSAADSTQTKPTVEEAPDFLAVSLLGDNITLQTYPNHYVILDFWGTWCKYCVQDIPNMVEYYAKYGDQMEIISVDVNDDENDLRDFVRQHEMDWTHVMNDMDDPDGGLAGLYHVDAFPTKIIIDTDGYIVGRYVGDTPDFYDKLDELFNQ